MSDYLEVNRANWDDRVPIHAASRFYDVEAWLAERPGLKAWESEFIGDVTGLDVVHLQCHFGLDTLELLNAGAASVTGVDFSPNAITQARLIAKRIGAADRATFVESDVYSAADALGGRLFDLVFVSMGALCWLPSVSRWASQVGNLLRPGGRLYLHDGHPFVWSMAWDALRVEHTYFEETTPFVDDSDVTYTDSEVRLAHSKSYEWNHSIGEIVTAVIDHGLRIDGLVEHDWDVFQRYPWLTEADDGRFLSPEGTPRIPMTFTLTATKL